MDAEARVTLDNVDVDQELLSIFQETSDVVAVRGQQGHAQSKALSLRQPDSMQATRERRAHFDPRLSQIEALQAQLTRQMQQVSKVGCDTREFTLLLQELDRRVAAAEAKHTKLENRTASLSGNCSGLSAEMATQIRRIESLDARFIDFKRHSQEDIKNSLSELGQKLQQDLPRVSSNECTLQSSSSMLEEEVQRHTQLLQTMECILEERLSKQSMDLSKCFVGLNERCDLLMLELESFREAENRVSTSNQEPNQLIEFESLENSKLSVAKLDDLETRFAKLADNVATQAEKTDKLILGSEEVDVCVAKLDALDARLAKISDRVSNHAEKTEELLSYNVCVKQHTSSLEELSAKQDKLDQRVDKLDQRADDVIDSHRQTDADLTRLMNSFNQRQDDLRVMVIKQEENLKAEHERGLLIWKDYSTAMEGVDNVKKQLESGQDEMTRKLGSMESAIVDVHDSVGRVSTDSASIQQELFRHQSETSSFRQQINARVDEIATELSRCKDAVSAVDQHVVSLRPEIEGVRMKIDDYAKSQRAEFEPLETSLAAFSQQLKFVEEACIDVTNLKEKSASLEESSHHDRGRISSLEQRIIEEMHLTEKLTSLEKKIVDDVTAELLKSKAKASVVDEALETIKQDITDIREKIDSYTVEASLVSLSERVQSIEHACPEIESLKKKLGSLEQNIQHTETQSAELKSFEASLELTSQQTELHSVELKSLKESLATLREQVQLVEHADPATENTKTNLASLELLKTKVAYLELTAQQTESQSAKLKSLEKSLAKVSGQVQQSSPEIEDLNEKLASLEPTSQQILDASERSPPDQIADVAPSREAMAHVAAASFVSGIVRRYSEQSESRAFS